MGGYEGFILMRILLDLSVIETKVSCRIGSDLDPIRRWLECLLVAFIAFLMPLAQFSGKQLSFLRMAKAVSAWFFLYLRTSPGFAVAC